MALDKLNVSLVSVIIPLYNNKDYVLDTLDSVAQQDYPHIEIIVVDNGSDDGGDEVVLQYMQKDARVKLERQTVKGPVFARLAGINVARGEYRQFLDSGAVLLRVE